MHVRESDCDNEPILDSARSNIACHSRRSYLAMIGSTTTRHLRTDMRTRVILVGGVLLWQTVVASTERDSARPSPTGPTHANVAALFDSAASTSQSAPRLSLQYAIRGTALAEALNDPKLMASGYQLAGEGYFQAGDIDSAETCYRRALQHAESAGNDSLIASASNSIGIVSYLRNDYEQAYSWSKRALVAAQRSDLHKITVRAYNYLGLAAQNLSKEHSDISYYVLAMSAAMAIEDTDGIAITHNHIGNSFGARGSWDSALVHYRSALALREKIESNTNAISILLNNIGNALREKGNYQGSLDSYRRSLAISSKTGSKTLMATTYKNLAILLRTTKDYARALEYARMARDLSREISLNRVTLLSIEEIAKNLATLGDARGAYENLVAYVSLKDSLDSQVTRRRAAELQIQFETERKERQIQEMALDQEKTFRNFLVAIIGMTLALGLGLYWQYRQKSKAAHETTLQKAELERLYGELMTKNALLQESEAELRDSLREKEVLLKEIHHRVKNNLQIVSSLLNLQSLKVSNEQVLGLLKESQDRIRSMALIHERLYSSNDFARIELRGYLEELIKYLRNSYDAFSTEVTIDAEPISMPLDTAIPLGLIVSELVTNAFKHGVTDGNQGFVSVSLRSQENGDCTLVVKDNGKGLPEGFNIEKASTLGLQLVQILTKQLSGHLMTANNSGTSFTITFPTQIPAGR